MNLGSLKTIIANDLHRSDLTTQINQAVTAAVKFYNKEQFWFHEGQYTFTTSASQVWYTASSSIRGINTALATVSGTKYPLERWTYKDVDETDDGVTTGEPIAITYFQDMYRFSPTPDGAYVITLSRTRALNEPASASGSNAWTTSAAELIRFRSEWDIYHNYLRNPEMAQRAKAAEIEALGGLSTENRVRVSTNRIRKSGF